MSIDTFIEVLSWCQLFLILTLDVILDITIYDSVSIIEIYQLIKRSVRDYVRLRHLI